MSSAANVLPFRTSIKETHPKMRLREKLTNLKGAPALVLWCLWSHANREDACWPSMGTIAAECGVSLSTARTAVAKLEQLHLVERQFRKAHTTIYRLRIYGNHLVEAPVPHRPAGAPPTGLSVVPHRPAGAEVLSKEELEQTPQPPTLQVVPDPSPAAPPPAAAPPGRVVGADVEKLPDAAPGRKKRVGIRTKREFPPEAHSFVEQFREDFRDNVQSDFEFRVPIPASELAAASGLLREAPREMLEREKAFFVNDDRELPEGDNRFPGWKFVIRSVANWRDKREKIRNGMRTAGLL